MLVPCAVLAHDTWLVPAVFRTAPGTAVRVRLATSEAFPTSDTAAGPERIARFTIRTGSGTQPVSGYRVEGTFLVAEVKPDAGGHATVVAETKPRAFVLEPKVFNEYLQHEELKAIVAARVNDGQTGAPGRERYRKIAKTILCVGKTKDKRYAKPEGLWLEIVPERSPCGLRVGDSLPVQVLFGGRPLAGAHLAAGYEGVTGHKYPVWVLTDARGRAMVKFDRAGAWFVRTLHMVPAVGDTEADWQSAFSTLTFEVSATGEETGIRGVLEAQVAAWNRGDVEGFMQGYWNSERTTFVGASGVFRGWQALLERYRRNYPDRAAMGTLAFSELEITPLGPGAAAVIGRWQLEGVPGRPGGVFTLIVRKFPEGWKIVQDHTSTVMPPTDKQTD